MNLPWCGALEACTLLGLASGSKRILSVRRPARWNSFGLISCESGLWICSGSNRDSRSMTTMPSPLWEIMHRTAASCFYTQDRCLVIMEGRKWLPGRPWGVLAVFYVWGMKSWCAHIYHKYSHAHKTCSHTRYTRATQHQWHKPSAAVFRLHQALVMQRVPYNATRFHFRPRTAAPPFCSSHLHRSLCTHNM